MFDFKLEDFFFQRFKQQAGAGGCSLLCWNLDGFRVNNIQGRRARPLGNVNRSCSQHQTKAAENIPTVFFQRIGSVDGRAKAAAGTRIASSGLPSGCLSGVCLLSLIVEKVSARVRWGGRVN